MFTPGYFCTGQCASTHKELIMLICTFLKHSCMLHVSSLMSIRSAG